MGEDRFGQRKELTATKPPAIPQKGALELRWPFRVFPFWHKCYRILYSYINQSLNAHHLQVRGITLSREHDLGSNCSLWVRAVPGERLRIPQSWRCGLSSTPHHPLQSIPYGAWIHLLWKISSGNSSSRILAGVFSSEPSCKKKPHRYILSNGHTSSTILIPLPRPRLASLLVYMAGLLEWPTYSFLRILSSCSPCLFSGLKKKGSTSKDSSAAWG